MDNPFKKISIIGLGLIGGSIGLATRRYDKKIHIQGFAKSQLTLDIATSRGFVDEAFLNLRQIDSEILVIDNCSTDGSVEYLKSKNIPTAVYYPIPLNKHKPYIKYPVSESGLDVTYYLCKNVLSLPMHPYLKEDDIIYICENINKKPLR